MVDLCQEGGYNEGICLPKCNMLRNLRPFFKDKVVAYSCGAAVILTFAQLGVLLLRIEPKSAPIFLHYTTYLGVDFTGAWYLAYGIPVISFLAVLLNAGLAYALIAREKILGYVLTIGSDMVAAMLLIAVILIVRLNS